MPWDYFSMASKWWGAWMQNYEVLLDQWRESLSLGQTPSNLAQQMRDLYALMMSGGAISGRTASRIFEPFSNSIELKQFRYSDQPEKACFMAIANMQSEVTRLHGMGLLGNIVSMLSSMDGGFSIRVHRFAAYPVVEKLGLEVSHSENSAGGVPVDILKPCLPFWVNMDFNLRGCEPLATLVHDKPVNANPKKSDLPPYSPERYFGCETAQGDSENE